MQLAGHHKTIHAHQCCSIIKLFPSCYPSSVLRARTSSDGGIGHEICGMNPRCLECAAFADRCLFVGQFNLTWLRRFVNSTPLVAFMLLRVFLVFICSRLERGSTRTNQIQKAFLSLSVRKSTSALSPPFVCLPPTCTQHERGSDFNIQQCPGSVPRPTHQNTTMGRPEPLPLTGTQSPLSHSPFDYVSLPRERGSFSRFQSPSFSPSVSQIGDLTQNAHI